ncbi:MAG TPA: AAA family ATPase, partial [Sedimenticola thiotaurini]|nr:AAA family ATPase [Sedimenticola thiotaurini]
MRPRTLDEFVGQAQVVGEGKPLRQAIASDRYHSMIFWGPPGTGKTTLARLIAAHSGAHFISLSAVLSGVKEIRAAVAEARRVRQEEGRPTVLFIDEVHRFNKSQQDAFLPHVEDGTLVFIGATTENPSFELNNALLSRARTYVLKGLSPEELEQVVERAAADTERGLGGVRLDPELRRLLAEAADGDARRALNLLELAADLSAPEEGISRRAV